MIFFLRLFFTFFFIFSLFGIWGFSMKVKTYFFTGKEIIGTVTNIQPPIGENQHYTYKVRYLIGQKDYFISNNYKIKESYQIGDKVTLIIDKNDYADAIFKGNISPSITAIIFSILSAIIFYFSLLSTFRQKN